MSHWPRLTVTEVDNSVYDWTCVLEMATGRHESNAPDQRVFRSNPPQSTNQNIYISATVVSSVRFGESLLILCKNAKFDIASHFRKLNCDNTEIT